MTDTGDENLDALYEIARLLNLPASLDTPAVAVRDLDAENALLRAVAKAARLFRKADTGGSYNDRVECGALLDDKLASLEKKT